MSGGSRAKFLCSLSASLKRLLARTVDDSIAVDMAAQVEVARLRGDQNFPLVCARLNVGSSNPLLRRGQLRDLEIAWRIRRCRSWRSFFGSRGRGARRGGLRHGLVAVDERKCAIRVDRPDQGKTRGGRTGFARCETGELVGRSFDGRPVAGKRLEPSLTGSGSAFTNATTSNITAPATIVTPVIAPITGQSITPPQKPPAFISNSRNKRKNASSSG